LVEIDLTAADVAVVVDSANAAIDFTNEVGCVDRPAFLEGAFDVEQEGDDLLEI
jgi:hypothetical protein